MAATERFLPRSTRLPWWLLARRLGLWQLRAFAALKSPAQR
jgi:hypothetical protein